MHKLIRSKRRSIALEIGPDGQSKQFVEGEKFLYLGNEYTLHVTGNMHGKLLFEDRFILNERYLSRARMLFERWYKEEAFMFFTLRCKVYAGNMGVHYNSIELSGAKYRWGSCYPNGRLRFNWRLVMAPRDIIDYVVVHELAHLAEPNHSKRFWAVVEKAFRDHREARKWLKDNQFRLNLSNNYTYPHQTQPQQFSIKIKED